MPVLANTPIAFTREYITDMTNVRLSDGTPVSVRPIEPGDAQRIAAMHDRLSADTLYFRYLHPYKPTAQELTALEQMTSKEGAAFVAVLEGEPERVIGIAHYKREGDDRAIAQPALVIEDEFQGRGLGRTMMRILIEHAIANGIRTLNITVHPANIKMTRLIEKSRLAYKARLEYGALEMQLFL